MTMVLEHYEINWLRRKGDSLRGKCPIHEGEGDRTFHVSLSKDAFNCFSCKAHGNVLDFAAAMDNSTVRDAAIKLADIFGVGDGTAPAGKPATQAKQPARKPVSDPEPEGPINPPLGFELRLDPDHEYGQGRGLTPETIKTFGCGFCLSKGTSAGRYLIPLHDASGELIGYASRSVDDSEPKYLFPRGEKGFRKSRLLFNLHRVIENQEAHRWTVLVEGFFDTMHVVQAGYPCVGLLGSTLSAEQEEMLCRNFQQVVLLFDGDEAGRKATDDCLLRLGRRMLVRAIALPEEQQPDSMNFEELTQLLEL